MAQNELSEYELQRQRRIEENQRIMHQMGVVDAAANIQASHQASQAQRPQPRPKRKFETLLIKQEDLRRSDR